MYYKKSSFLVIISWLFILCSPLIFFASFMISVSSSTLSLNMDIFLNALKETSLDDQIIETVIMMIEYTSIISIIILALSVVAFFAGFALLKKRSWARSYISSLFLVKTVVVSLMVTLLLYIASTTPQVAELGILLTGIDVVLYLVYKKLSSKQIINICNS